MKKSQHFILIIGYIFTFGILYFVLNKKAKKQATISNDSLTLTNKIPFNVNDFVTSLGGFSNIEFSSSTISSIRIKLRDKNHFNEDKFKKFKPKGYMWDANNTITILFGDFSFALDEAIKKNL